MKITHRKDYREARKAEYPDIGDQLDAIWKTLSILQGLPPDAKSMLVQVSEIKSKYPKGV